MNKKRARFVRLACLLLAAGALLNLPRVALAHGGHGLGGIAASLILDTAGGPGGCTFGQ